MSDLPSHSPVDQPILNWGNVGIGFSFLLFDSIISSAFGLNIGPALITAGIRCVVQLALVATVLQKIFDADNLWAVGAITLLLNLLASIEIVVNKSKYRTPHMLPAVLFTMICSTIPVSIIGARFAMGNDPFWTPSRYIPLLGMLAGATMPGIVIAVNYIHKELFDNRDKTEMYLAFGASRLEASRPIGREALRLALTPSITQMSVIGIIAVPGMMTGAILGGASVDQAAKLQTVIMFMISSSTALATTTVTVLTLSTTLDGNHRVRTDRMDGRQHFVWRVWDHVLHVIWTSIKSGLNQIWSFTKRLMGRGDEKDDLRGASERLLSDRQSN